MSTEISVYESADFGSIRMFEENGDVYAVADDLAKALGYREARDMIRSLEADEFTPHSLRGKRGDYEANVVNESGIYHAILMRKRSFVKDPDTRARVEAFQRWVTHEVLPSIRRTGAYANPRWAPESDEDGMLLLSRAVKFAERKLAEAEAEVEEMRPKAELADAMLGSEDTILVRELANLITQAGFPMRQKDLFERLRDEGFLIKANTRDRNQPTRYSIDHGLMEVRERPVDCGGTTRIKRTPRITPKGQAYFLNRYAGARALPGASADA